MQINKLDHLVLTVRDITVTSSFYSKVIGMNAEKTDQGRHALHFGTSKINLHQLGAEFTPHAKRPTPGSADLCFLTERPIDRIIEHLKEHHVPIEEGPVQRIGASGPLLSIYFRDPDGNLLEIANALSNPVTKKYSINHAD